MNDISSLSIDKSISGNLSEKVAEAILRAAIEGRIEPGKRLTEVELARELEVSRVPIREALRSLEAHGVVETSQRETRIFSADADGLRELIEARKLIQLAALPDAIRRCAEDPELLYGFEDTLDVMRRRFGRKDAYALAMAVMDFHRHIFVAAGNKTLKSMFDGIAHKILIVLGLTLFEHPESRIISQHEKILTMIREGRTGDAVAFLAPLIDEGLISPHGT